jgi:GNAT superfamily N-acetyltransferase
MWWRLGRSEWTRGKGEGNRKALRKLLQKGPAPGIVAYATSGASGNPEPIAWCAVAPRSDYPALSRSRILKPVDDTPVWSVTCFFVQKNWRRQGLTRKLLAAASRFARENGAKIIEGYPTEPRKGDVADVFVFTGLASAFHAEGFEEAARRSPSRPIMRRTLRAG